MARLPERIGKYEVIRLLGRGGMGTVYTTGAAAVLHQALALDSTNAAALAMLSRIQQKTPAATRGRMVAAICAIVGAGVGGALWTAAGGDGDPPARPAPSPTASVAVAAPNPAPVISIASPPVAPPKEETATPRPATVADSGRRARPLGPAVQPSPNVPVATAPPPAITLEAPAPANTAVAPPVVTPPNPLDRERPGILQALNRYQSAYRERNVKSLVSVYPSLPRETRQATPNVTRGSRRAFGGTHGLREQPDKLGVGAGIQLGVGSLIRARA